MLCLPPTPGPVHGNNAQESETRHADAVEKHKRHHPTSFLSQFICLLRRTFLLILRDKVCAIHNVLLVSKPTAMHNINQLLPSEIVIIIKVSVVNGLYGSTKI